MIVNLAMEKALGYSKNHNKNVDAKLDILMMKPIGAHWQTAINVNDDAFLYDGTLWQLIPFILLCVYVFFKIDFSSYSMYLSSLIRLLLYFRPCS